MEFLLTVYLALACLAWSALYCYAALMWHKIPQFARLAASAPVPDPWPRVSLIITACNEAETIAAALQSMQAQTYPALEIIVVNDRSEDATAEIVTQLAQQDPRIRLINIDELPPNWLGKVHALHSATRYAGGEWLLFSDADIHFQAGAIEHAIAYAEAERLDHLALIPQTVTDSKLLKATMNAFGLLFLVSARAQAVANPHSSAAIGVGAFNLVRRRCFDQTPGFEWLRMEVADDVGLALMLKQHGARTRFALADQALSVAWYHDLPGMARGLEKNIVGPTTRYHGGSFTLNALLLTLFLCAPPVAITLWQSPAVWFGLMVPASIVALSVRALPGDAKQGLYWLLSPVGLVIIGVIYLRAGILLLKRNGIVWRGTHYNRAQLRRYQRVRL